MIAPEPNWACDLSGLQPGEAGKNIPLPAAGRLGVIEEWCPLPHDVDLLTLWPAVLPCPRCGAAV